MGYQPNFIDGVVLDLPELLPGTRQAALNDGTPIDYTHHSIVFNEQRGFAVYAAHNVSGAELVSGIDRRSFTLDPAVPRELQVDDSRGYRGFPTKDDNPWDAGHLARRVDLHWPSRSIALDAERDSAHWTNLAPQHKSLNRGSWRKIEDWLLQLGSSDEPRMSVFTGPVFTASDMEWRNHPDEVPIRIPAGYWKVAVLKRERRLRAVAFLIWQTDVHPSREDFDANSFDPVLEQVRVLTVEHLAGLSFGETIRQADPLHLGRGKGDHGDLGRARSGSGSGSPVTSVAVESPADILI